MIGHCGVRAGRRLANASCSQQSHEVTDQLDAGWVTVDFGRVKDHLIDQRTSGFKNLSVVRVRKTGFQIADLRGVDLRNAWM